MFATELSGGCRGASASFQMQDMLPADSTQVPNSGWEYTVRMHARRMQEETVRAATELCYKQVALCS